MFLKINGNNTKRKVPPHPVASKIYRDRQHDYPGGYNNYNGSSQSVIATTEVAVLTTRLVVASTKKYNARK